MSLLALIAATFTFSATATGVEKGAPIEFLFIGEGSDRDYEALFVLDGSVEDWCRGVESAGLVRGKPEELKTCTLWPIGCLVTLNPSPSVYLDSKLPSGEALAPIIYTGGTRLSSGIPEAATNSPLSVFSLYSLAQSPLVYDAHYLQGEVYNAHHAKETLKKGTRVQFTLSWDENSLPKPLFARFSPGNAGDVLTTIRQASVQGPVEVLADFDPSLTVREASSCARALAVIDSNRIKINGRAAGHLYFRAFLPDASWTNRQQRIVQPYELTIAETNRLLAIESDWSVEGPDPKLTERALTLSEAVRATDTDTCFIFIPLDARLEKIYTVLDELKDSKIINWYVFGQE